MYLSVPPRLSAGVAAAALTIVAVLSFQNRALREDAADLQYRFATPQAGQYVPGFRTTDLHGDSIQVVTGEPEARQVLFIFNTRCPYCLASIPAWNALTERLGSEGVEAIGISLDSLPITVAYSAHHQLDYAVTLFPSRAIRQMYRGGHVPATLVVDGSGYVVHARMGQLAAGAASDSILAAVRWRPHTPAPAMLVADSIP